MTFVAAGANVGCSNSIQQTATHTLEPQCGGEVHHRPFAGSVETVLGLFAACCNAIFGRLIRSMSASKIYVVATIAKTKGVVRPLPSVFHHSWWSPMLRTIADSQAQNVSNAISRHAKLRHA